MGYFLKLFNIIIYIFVSIILIYKIQQLNYCQDLKFKEELNK